MRRTSLFLFVVAASLSARAAPPDITAGEFKLYKEYTDALGDERVQKLPEKKRLSAIAKNFKVNEKQLQAAVDKGTKVGASMAKDSEAEIRTLVEASAMKGRITELKVDDAASHVVAYVAWKNLDGAKLEEEAALVALLASKGAPVASTIAVWALDGSGTRKVFEAKIASDAAARFTAERIPMFSAKYIKVFEDVKNAYKGTPPGDPAPAPGSN